MIHQSRHPEYDEKLWDIFDLVYKGGEDFKEAFLFQRNKETTSYFELRKKITPISAHAKSAVNKIKNSIFSRIRQGVIREGGPESYQLAFKGENGGVDRKSSSMNTYLGRKILPKLLSTGKVGVLVEAPAQRREGDSPYLICYRAQDIRNWTFFEGELVQVLLRHNELILDEYGLPKENQTTFRLYSKTDQGIVKEIFNHEGKSLGVAVLDLEKIPFHIFELTESLLQDVSSHQIALLNLASSDVSYAYRGNIPIFTRQVSGFFQHMNNDLEESSDDLAISQIHGKDSIQTKDSDYYVSPDRGIEYDRGEDRPDFISPSAEPLRVSMEKQDRLADEIRMLVNISLTNMEARSASAESKRFDERNLETGLSAVGQELEIGENEILKIWSDFEGVNNTGLVTYPDNYELKDDADRRKSADDILILKEKIPSARARIELQKEASIQLFSNKIPQARLKEILQEIEENKGQPSGAKEIAIDYELGLVGPQTASMLRGYEDNEWKIAQEAKAKRMEEAQSAQRGDEDFEPTDEKGGRSEGRLNEEDQRTD